MSAADVTFVFTSLIHTVSILSFSIFPKKSTKKDHWKSFPLPAVCSVSDNSYFIFVFPTPTRLSFLAVFVSLCSYHSQLFSEILWNSDAFNRFFHLLFATTFTFKISNISEKIFVRSIPLDKYSF